MITHTKEKLTQQELMQQTNRPKTKTDELTWVKTDLLEYRRELTFKISISIYL